MDLIEFLRARLDEDEAAAKAATPGPWYSVGDHVAVDVKTCTCGGGFDVMPHEPYCGCELIGGPFAVNPSDESCPDAAHVARHDPARVLADVATKRAIVDLHDPTPAQVCPEDDSLVTPCPTLRHLAAVYADHPDYDERWRP